MEYDVYHRNRLEFLGELAGGLAHELNQPLNVIRMACENLTLTVDPAETYVHEKVIKIISQIDRASRIVSSMGIFSKQDIELNERFTFESVLENALQLIGNQFSLLDIEISIEAPPHLPFLQGNSTLLEQVLINFLVNARDSIIARRERDKEEKGGAGSPGRIILRMQDWRESETIRISVIDNGTGIDESKREVLFESFYTTKQDKGGAGLGLSICRRIILGLKGRIDCCNNQIGGGAEFWIELPLPRQRLGNRY